MAGRKRITAAAAALFVATISISATLSLDDHGRNGPVHLPQEVDPGPAPWMAYPRDDVPEPLRASPAIMTAQPVYRHSVIAGGIRSAAELAEAMMRSPEVAAHFRALDLRRLQPARLSRDGEYYLSYRKDGGIYWTAKKQRVPAGEEVLAGGDDLVRARCGNLLSLLPMRPVMPDASEPSPLEFDEIEVPSLPVVTPISSPPGIWLPILIPFIPVIVFPPGGDRDSPGPPPPIPEPATWTMMMVGLGLLGVGAWIRRGKDPEEPPRRSDRS